MSKNKRFVRNENNMIFGIIGDEETVTGIFSFFSKKERYRDCVNITGCCLLSISKTVGIISL